MRACVCVYGINDREEENIQVILRVRPLVGSGVNDNDTIKCLNYVDEKAVKLESNKNIFTFDEVLTEESTQVCSAT